jgi:tetratricopeptide (TPR) repeat protein
VVWANLDGGFVLGLAVVALVWLGDVLDGIRKDDGRQKHALLQLSAVPVRLSVLAAVCLVNPSGPYAFAVPAELAWAPPTGAAGWALTPFQEAYVASVGKTPASLAYFPLLGLGLLSFIVNLPRWSWRRFLPWLGLALLSAFQARAVPVFAVVAGPVTAWNLQDWTARKGMSERRPGWAGRVLAAGLGLALLVCAWPGWLQAPPFEPRRWAIEPSSSLEQGAAATRRWHQEGRQRAGNRALHLSSETASAFAWFCPEDQGLQDEPLAAAIRGDPDAPLDWDERMRSQRVDRVILYDPDRGRLFATLGRLLGDPAQWPLLYLEGDLAVFGWRDPRKKGSEDLFQGREVDLNRLAFRPAPEKKAPREPAEREAGVGRWWEAFWKPAAPRPIDRDEATLHLLHAEGLRSWAARRHLIAWEASHSAALVGAAGGWPGHPAALIDAHLRLVLLRPLLPRTGSPRSSLPAPDRMALALQQQFTWQRDDVPPALLFLAVRAARRALADHPNDAQAHLVLGQCYLRLLRDTRERAWGQRMPKLVQLRRAQAAAALHRAVSLQPDLAPAHLSLGQLYQEMGYLDLTLKHLRAYFKLAQKARRKSDLDELGQEQEARFAQQLDRLAREVETREQKHDDESAGARLFDRASLALEKGLAGKALNLLLESDVAVFGAPGMRMELDLLLNTGRAKEVKAWTDPQQKSSLGPASYHWLRTRALAATGDYALAREELDELNRSLSPGTEEPGKGGLRETMAMLIGQAVLDEGCVDGPAPYHLRRVFIRRELRSSVARLARKLTQAADVSVLRGLLALEEGEVDLAAADFSAALALWKDEVSASAGSGLDFDGRVIAQGCLAWLE